MYDHAEALKNALGRGDAGLAVADLYELFEDLAETCLSLTWVLTAVHRAGDPQSPAGGEYTATVLGAHEHLTQAADTLARAGALTTRLTPATADGAR